MNPSRHSFHFSVRLLVLAIGCGLLAGCRSSAVSTSGAPASATNGISPSIPIFLTVSNPVSLNVTNPVSVNINNPAPGNFTVTNIIQLSQPMSQLQTTINNLSNGLSGSKNCSLIITNIWQPPPPARDGFFGMPVEIAVALVTAILAVIGYFYRQWAEGKSVQNAIMAEIDRLYHVIGRHTEWRLREADRRKRSAARSSETKPPPSEPLIAFSHPIFSAQKEKIGVLDRDAVGDVVRFYGWVDYINDFQSVRKEYADLNKLEKFDAVYNAMLKKFMAEFKPIYGSDYKPGHPDSEPEDQ